MVPRIREAIEADEIQRLKSRINMELRADDHPAELSRLKIKVTRDGGSADYRLIPKGTVNGDKWSKANELVEIKIREFLSCKGIRLKR